MRKNRTNLIIGLSKCLLVLLLALSFVSDAEDTGGKPAVLVYTGGPQWISFPLLKYLHKREGFNVNYTGSVQKKTVPLTWDLVKKYNCVIILMHEPGSSGGRFSLENSKVIKRYLNAGGGVLLLPDVIHWDTDSHFINWVKAWGEPFGAWFLRRQAIFEKDDKKATAGGYFYQRYHRTENIAKNPVTKGVNNLWYNVYGNNYAKRKAKFSQRTIRTYPLKPTKEWQVLARASKTASSEPVCSEFSHLKHPIIESEKGYESEPPLFAIREYGKGRMAFCVMNAENHFVAGMHHNKDGDMEELKGGYVLEAGFNGKKSDFLKLLVNTINWLSAPSLKSGAVGGYQQDVTRLDEPVAPPTMLTDWDRNIQIDHGSGLSLQKAAGFQDWPVFKGIIGAQTNLSGGKGTVADYKASAKKAGLDYVIFLEDFTKMTPEKLKKLKEECKKLTDDKTLLIPGFRIRDNRGHHQFLFGLNNIPWPEKEFLTKDGKMLNMAAREKTSGLPHIGFVCDQIISKNALGYFDLHSSDITRMWNLKLYHAIGLFYYKDGKQIEGLKDNFKEFLEVNNAGCNIQPYTINIVTSPEKMVEATRSSEMFTYVRANKLTDITKLYGGLKYDYLTTPYVFSSNGPQIIDWSCLNRDCVVHAESYVTPNYRFDVNLTVKSDAGIKEIKIWDGLELYMKILPRGAKEYRKLFHFNHNQQKNLILEVTDVNGKKAISAEQFDRNHMNMHYWCGDRINGALKHGPLYFFGSYGEQGINFVSKGIDSFNLFASPMSVGGPEASTFVSSAGKFQNGRLANRPLQELVSEDAGVYSNKCCMYFPESEKLWSVWGTYGPLVDTKLYDLYQTYISFRNHLARANPYIPSLSGIPNTGDVVPGLNISEYRFKVDQTLEQLPVTSFRYGKYGNIKGNEMVVAFCRNPKELPIVFTLSNRELYYKRLKPFLDKNDNPFKIERGGYFAVFGSKSGAGTRVSYNVGDIPFIAKTAHGGIIIFADVKGKKVKAGDTLTIKTLGLTGKVPKLNNAARYDLIADYLGLDGKPGYQLKMVRGKQLPVTVGFCDLQAQNGAVEFSLKRPKENLQLVLPVRIMGLNDKWSAYCFDKLIKQARPIGVYQGTAYARFDPDYHDITNAAIGHPVIADNKDIVIVLTILGDAKYPARKGKKQFYGGLYSLQLNNPTDKDLKVKLTNNMDLPDFPFKTKTVEIKAGEVIDVLKK